MQNKAIYFSLISYLIFLLLGGCAPYRRDIVALDSGNSVPQLVVKGSKFGRIPATEADTFSKRYELEKDSIQKLNSIISDLVQKSIYRANIFGRCNKKRLIEKVKDELGGLNWSNLELQVLNDEEIEQIRLNIDKSIYVDPIERDDINVANSQLGSLLKLGKHIISSEKLGHFANLGHEYYIKIFSENQRITNVLELGRLREGRQVGLPLNNVYSYGNLVANFQGMYFWRHLLDQGPLGEKPYINCENESTWVLRKNINMELYIDGGWDDGVNCNEYKKPEIRKKIGGRIKELQEKDKARSYKCPVDEKECLVTYERYRKTNWGDLTEHFIGPRCKRIALREKKKIKNKKPIDTRNR